MLYSIDLHMHSHFANATSPQLTLENIALWAKRKGVHVIGTGDFTHPVWLKEIERTLQYDEPRGLYYHPDVADVFFAITSEISCVYVDNERTKKIHLTIVAPSVPVAQEINTYFGAYGDLAADGRPTLNLSCEEAVNHIMQIHPMCEVIPAHIWTPWFGCMGQRFGYDSLEACFKSARIYIHAIETGLSSDPYMNWLVLDDVTIVSFSDAHSLERIGRELTYIDGEIKYEDMINALRTNTIAYTVEFFPEEGKYHFSGHRKCSYVSAPEEDAINGGRCPVCKRKLTQGVYTRVMNLADKEHVAFIDAHTKRNAEGFITCEGKKPFVRLIQLDEIIAKTIGIKSVKAKKVKAIYDDILEHFGNESNLLIDPSKKLRETYPKIYKAILSVLHGKVTIIPGYDNTYGEVILP